MKSLGSIKVISSGFQTTIQDLGRYGYAHLGVSPSGAADSVSLRLANLLVGNRQDAAGLEMTLVGGAFEFESSCVVALAGSDFGATLDGQRLPLWTSALVKAGQVLRCGSTQSGARSYLCIRGGVSVPHVLGSASTHVMTSLGGFQGRPLRAGDVISYQEPPGGASFRPQRVKETALQQLVKREAVRVTLGPQADLFSDEVRSLFASSVYHIAEQANRMGLRLSGPPLKRRVAADLVTEGVPLGAVQVPHDGEPIILFVEHQTTGGYPKIASVVSADIHLVGQLRPRDVVRFEFISVERAVELLGKQEDLISTQSLESL